ncbi:TatD family hydrolase [Treponema sp. OMZ 840]|uniref:TatD family hydrolase n=1 Tax=Treponema sp. OMZ 840 TaxID=244313 RepID=UPI003D932E20
MIFADAHMHITDLDSWTPFIASEKASPVCSCAHCEKDWKKLTDIALRYPGFVVKAAGIHPQDPDKKHCLFLSDALEKNQADAIGEAGFDLFNPAYASRLDEQEQVWAFQLEAAVRYNKPLIIHCRKALHLIFRDAKKLAKVPSAVFHSFPGSPLEALSLVKRGINARFSFGKPLLNGNKRALLCASSLPMELLLAETDAPWQTLKGETATAPSDIQKVYLKICELRNVSIEYVCSSLYENFKDSFAIL